MRSREADFQKQRLIGFGFVSEPPSGQVENGEDVLIALKREILEKSGAEIETGRLLAMYSNVSSIPTKLMLTFEAKFIAGKLRVSEESLDVGWFSPEEALDRVTHEVQKQKLQDALQDSDGVIYRVYESNPYRLIDTRMI